MISQAAVDAVTSPSHISSVDDDSAGLKVQDDEVVAELRRLEGLGADDARQLGREAVVHVGGHVQLRARRRGLVTARAFRRRTEVWWVPRWAVRS